jgi:hypothetical protein
MKLVRNLFMTAAVGGMLLACSTDVLSPDGQTGGGNSKKPPGNTGTKATSLSISASPGIAVYGGTTTLTGRALLAVGETGSEPKCGTLVLEIQAPGGSFQQVASKAISKDNETLSFTTASLTLDGDYSYKFTYTPDANGCNYAGSTGTGSFTILAEDVNPPACSNSLVASEMTAVYDGVSGNVNFSITYRLNLCDGATGRLQGGLSNWTNPNVSFTSDNGVVGTDKIPGGKNSNRVITWLNATSGDYTITFSKPLKYANGAVTGQWTIKDADGNNLATAVAPQTFTITVLE